MMEVFSTKEELLRATQRIHQALDKQTHDSCSTHGKITMSPVVNDEVSGLQLYGTDLQSTCKCLAIAEVRVQGNSLVLDLDRLKRILEALPEGDIMLSLKDERLLFSGGATRRLWMPIGDQSYQYPKEGMIPEEYQVTISGPKLAAALRRVDPLRESKDLTRNNLTGVQVRVTGDRLTIDAAAPTRAGRTSLTIGRLEDQDWEGYLPRGIIRPVLDMCDNSDFVVLAREPANVYAMNEEAVLSHSLPDAPLPKIDQYLGLEDGMVLSCSVLREPFQQALQALHHAAGTGINPVSILCDDEDIKLSLHEGMTTNVIAVDNVVPETMVEKSLFVVHPDMLLNVIRSSKAPKLTFEVMPDQYIRIRGSGTKDEDYDGEYQAFFPVVVIPNH